MGVGSVHRRRTGTPPYSHRATADVCLCCHGIIRGNRSNRTETGSPFRFASWTPKSAVGCINPCGQVMDVLRSCYSTKMRFTNGGPEYDVQWYFCPPGAKVFSGRHSYASLNYQTGRWPTSDTSIGEVVGALRPWRNGSLPAPYDGQRIGGTAGWFSSGCSGHPDLVWGGTPAWPLACMLTPPAPCFTTALSNYDLCDISYDNGSTWTPLTFASTDHWTGSVSYSGTAFDVSTTCGGISSGSQSLLVQQHTTPTNFGQYNASSFSSSYPPTWHYALLAGSPTWSGPAQVLLRIRCSDSTNGFGTVHGTNLTSATLNVPSGNLAGDSLFCWLTQSGVGNGGSIVVPTLPSGWIQLHAGGSNGQFLYWKQNAPQTSTVTITGIGAPDNFCGHIGYVRTRPSASIVASNYLDAQAAATTLNAGTLSFTGDNCGLLGFFHNSQGSGVAPRPAASFGTASSPFGTPTNVPNSGSTNPTYQTQTDSGVRTVPQAAGSYNCTVHSSLAYGWASAFIIVR
jgi:hypothetical protein